MKSVQKKIVGLLKVLAMIVAGVLLSSGGGGYICYEVSLK